MSAPYSTLLRNSLAYSRRQGVAFEIAWAHAEAQHPRPSIDEGWTPGVMAFAKAAFREGYYRRNVVGSASILGERTTTTTSGVLSVGQGGLFGVGTLVA